jgi:hypothetical protein
MENLKFPIGPFDFNSSYTSEELKNWIETIAAFPNQLSETLESIKPEMLDWPYRPQGWTIRQVIHHCADSHMNALIRFKLTLTESNPTIKPYNEASWAELSDTKDCEISDSIMILKGVHSRFDNILKNLSETDFTRTYFHPEHQKSFSLAMATSNYAWHSKHHLAHVKQAMRSNGKYIA